MAIDLKQTASSKVIKTNQKKENSFLQRELHFGPIFSMRQKEVFYGEVALMLNSGLTLKDALELLAHAEKITRRKQVLHEIAKQIRAGFNLEEALRKSKVFSDYECITIRMGEESGKLSESVRQLGEYFSNRVAQKRTLTGALTYPIVILATSIGAVGFMMLFMVPMFRDVFARTGKELPTITKVVIKLSDLVSNNWWWVTVCCLVLVCILYKQRNTATFHKYKSTLLSTLPIIGQHYRTGVLMQWNGAMSLMLESGVNLVAALRLCGKLSKDYQLQQTLIQVEEKLMSGKSLHEAMQEETIFDKRLVLMVRVAEESHALDRVFKQLAEQFRTDMEHRSKMMGSLLEPFIILFLGLVVGFILLAMYLPIFQMGAG